MAGTVALLLAAAYLLGSIPFAWIVTRAVRGVDVRTIGSGNVGATNAARVLGGRWFLAVFLLDAAKGAAPVLLFAGLSGLGGTELGRMRMACGLAAILGHVFPVFLGFRGGKGVATGAGVLTALAPVAAACALGVFGIVLAAARYVSLASVSAAATLWALAWAFGASTETIVFCALVGVLVAVLHRRNFARIAAGTEPRAFRGGERPSA
jgi:glycerol-3-phosphate acyltransferase PlsY